MEDDPAANAASKAARPRPADLARGTNQSGVRLYNERLVLSLIRRNGQLPKAEIARLTGLSPQTITMIMRSLADDGLVVARAPRRGKIGQPSVPFALAPEGAFSLGLKIGRRSSDLVLLDFAGAVRGALREAHAYPEPGRLLDFAARGIATLTGAMTGRQKARVAGIGIAAPFELWNWEAGIGAPPAVLDRWRGFDARAELGRICPWPVRFCNDATAACGAELILGNPGRYQDFLYFFLGSFIGGGIVLDGSLQLGRTGNAGALGSMPVAPSPGAGGRPPQQLIRSASIYVLEHKLVAAGREATMLWRSPDDWGEIGAGLEEWIEEAAEGLAFAIVAATAVIDFAAAVIDGALPASIRSRIVERTRARAAALDRRGLSPVTIVEGTIGSGARAIGGACLPLLANFARDREVLFKENA
jgi:predicted NBD/HSP70 family sugar kinase